MVLYANEMKLCPFQGIKFLFFDQFKSVPHKIYDSCCCEMRMSATSLTFWFIILNCVMQARPPRAFPLFFLFFLPDFFSFPILSWFSRFPSYFLFSALFFPNFLTRKGGMLLDAVFPCESSSSFFSRGAWLRGKQKTNNFFFFSAHYHPCFPYKGGMETYLQ